MAKLARTVGFCVAGLVALCLFLVMAFDPPPFRFHQPDSAVLRVELTDVKLAPRARPSIESGLGCKERLQALLRQPIARPTVTFQDWLNKQDRFSVDNLRVLDSKRSDTGGPTWALRFNKAKKQMCWLRSRDVELGFADEYCVPMILEGEAFIQAGDFGPGINFNGIVFDKRSYTATVASQDTTGAMLLHLDCFYPR